MIRYDLADGAAPAPALTASSAIRRPSAANAATAFLTFPPLPIGAGHPRPCDARNLGHSAPALKGICAGPGLRPLVAARPGQVDERAAARRPDRLHDRRARAVHANAEPSDESAPRARSDGPCDRPARVHEELHALARPEVRAAHRQRREVRDPE